MRVCGILFIVFTLISCNKATPVSTKVAPKNSVVAVDLVLNSGDKVVANTDEGIIEIVAGKGLSRTYTWDGASRSVDLWARKEPWMGALGGYYPGPGEHWREHKGITRCVTRESVMRFETAEAFYEWINGLKWARCVYTNDGLVVGWMRNYPRKQLSVELYQVLINGEKPKELKNSQDSRISYFPKHDN